MMIKMLDRIFNRWTNWEPVEENKQVTQKQAMWDGTVFERQTFVDIYKRTNKYNGLIKYKTIERLI